MMLWENVFETRCATTCNVLSAAKERELFVALQAEGRGVIRHPMFTIHVKLILDSNDTDTQIDKARQA